VTQHVLVITHVSLVTCGIALLSCYLGKLATAAAGNSTQSTFDSMPMTFPLL
jgi:hypothetical protein